MSERSREERLQIMLSPEELTALDDFRFKNRMPSRAAAVRELLKRDSRRRGLQPRPSVRNRPILASPSARHRPDAVDQCSADGQAVCIGRPASANPLTCAP